MSCHVCVSRILESRMVQAFWEVQKSANYSLTASLDLIGLDTADNMLMKAIKNAFRIKTLIMWSNNFLYTSVIFHGRHDSIVKVQKF